jgi:mRNA interferase HigB
VRVISQKILQDFWDKHPDAKESLREWFKTALLAEWESLVDVRRIYRHADAVETEKSGILTVFNICGNKYRLIVRIKYQWKLINIRCVLTHAQYDKGNWKG